MKLKNGVERRSQKNDKWKPEYDKLYTNWKNRRNKTL